MRVLEGFDRGRSVDFDRRKGVEVDADRHGGTTQFGGLGGVGGSHGESVADGQDGEAEVEFLGDLFHVLSERGVAGVVERPLGTFDDEAGGIAAVAAIGQGAGVDGVDHFRMAAGDFHGAAVVHRQGIFNALFSEPVGNFPVGDDLGAGLIRERHGVGHMVEMSVRDQNHIRFDAGDINRGGERVRSDEGVEKQAATAGFHQEAGMAEVGVSHSEVIKAQGAGNFQSPQLVSFGQG